MREILFKAKRIDNGEWVEGYLLRDDCTGQYFIHASGNSVNESDKVNEEGCLRFVAFEVDESTICQYTGLTDKNGRMIWENDIVRYNSEDDLVPCNVVKYGMYDNLGNMDCYLGFYMDWLDNKSCLRRDIGFWVKNRDIEVIGNVFDNPELLESEVSGNE